jgi:F-type H+-transporting ATPase subunit epsilon
MRIRADKDWIAIALLGGFAEVEENEVTILVNGAERGDQIDHEKARSAFSEAEQRLTQAQKGNNRQDQIQANQAYKKARARYQATGGMVG